MAKLITIGDTWNYFKGTSEPPSDWADIGFDDSLWLSGSSGFGYGDGDDNTELLDMEGNYFSVFIRIEFTVADRTQVSKLLMNILRDDGFVAYINGVEAIRQTMPAGTISYNTPASGNHEADHTDFYDISTSISDLVTGTNVFAVQGHNVTIDSSDFSLSPELEVITGLQNLIVSRTVKRKRAQKRRSNKGIYITGDLFSELPLHLDQWIGRKPKREKAKPRTQRKGHYSFVDISVPPGETITIDKWLGKQKKKVRRKIHRKTPLITTEFIDVIQEVDGNFFDTGVISYSFDNVSEENVEFTDDGYIAYSITPGAVEDFQLEDTGTINYSISFPDTGVEVFNSGVPGFAYSTVIINGINRSELISGNISVIRSDNAAARFSLNFNSDPDLLPATKPSSLLNKVVEIRFSVADMDGVIADYIPVFVGICKRVGFNEDALELQLSGFDYGGVHQTKGEFVSQNITEVLTGSVYTSTAQTLTTGQNPIWGVEWQGNSLVVDGADYFVDTFTGQIVVPISSRVLQYPGSFTYKYSNPFDTMKDIIQGIVGQKGWILNEDNITIADYTNTSEQPVLSLSNESVIDVCRKFLELSGAKVESNLYPKLRVYSEVENFATPVNTITLDETDIFENSLTFSVDLSNLLTEQTVRSVQKVNASISVSGSQTLAEFEGQKGSVNPFAMQGGSNVDNIDYQTPAILASHRIRKQGIYSLSFSVSGTFSLFFGYNDYSASISASDWSWRVEDEDFVFELKHKVVTAGGVGSGGSGPFGSGGGGGGFYGSSSVLIAFPAIEYELVVNGSRIEYGKGTTEDLKVVTASRPVTGMTETLKGDVYENPFIETATHAGNIANAILNEAGNVYTARFEIPIFIGKDMNIGDNIEIERDGGVIFTGLIKTLAYNVNTATGVNAIAVVCKGVGVGI